jgi:hypothetical protein
MTKVKHESVSVLRSAPSPYFPNNDSTNGGITSMNDRLTVGYGSEEVWEDLELGEVQLVLCEGTRGESRVIRDKEDFLNVLGNGGYVKTVVKSKEGLIGPMNGGNYVVNNNGMGIITVPIKVHDRHETQELYDALSR